jgi:hypothetical protein
MTHYVDKAARVQRMARQSHPRSSSKLLQSRTFPPTQEFDLVVKLWRLFGFLDHPTDFSGLRGQNSGKRLAARDYMAFKRHIIVVSGRARYLRRANWSGWAHKVGIAVLPFLAETSR